MEREWKPAPRRIAIFRALKLGDMLCAVPALRALRRHFSEAEIILIGLPWAREFVDRYGTLLDGFREFPGFPGLPEQEPDAERLAAFFASIRAERFDLAIQMHGSGTVSNQVTAELGARVQAGFSPPGGPCPDPATFLAYPEHGLEIRRLLRLVEHLGVAPCGESLEFPLKADDRAAAQQLAHAHGFLDRAYVCIHGGASVPERRWPAESFAAVADALAECGLAIVLTGTRSESGLTRAIAAAMRAPAIDLAGQTPLGTLAAVLARSRLLVCNDTGVSHVADGLGVPSVVISTGNNPERWAPPDGRLHRVLCRGSGVAASEVIAEAKELLSTAPGPVPTGRPLVWGELAADDRPSTAGRNERTCDRCAS
jgi:ADP-heptose:LPS heptosyltransferase